MKFVLLTTFLFLLSANSIWAKQPMLSSKKMATPPPRIIRTCCSFGAEMKMMGVPGFKLTEVIGISDLGNHKYLGDKKKREGNGIIYTKNGGFIDMGHVRDQADWTAYLYNLIIENKTKGRILKVLGHEGGLKNIVAKDSCRYYKKDRSTISRKNSLRFICLA